MTPKKKTTLELKRDNHLICSWKQTEFLTSCFSIYEIISIHLHVHIGGLLNVGSLCPKGGEADDRVNLITLPDVKPQVFKFIRSLVHA